MSDKESGNGNPGAGQGVFGLMGARLDRLVAKMQKKLGDVANKENMDKLNSSLRSAGETMQKSLSTAADKAGTIWKDSTGAAESKVAAWRKEHEREIKDFTTRADGWARDQKGNLRSALDKLVKNVQDKLNKS